MSRRVLVAGIGNIFLADDGFGSEVARELARQPLPRGTRVVDYGIRGMHLAYDLLEGYDALVIIDTVPGRGTPGELLVLEVGAQDLGAQDLGAQDLGAGELDPHGMAPVAVLASLSTLGGARPRTFVVGCAPQSTDEGMGLSPAVQAAVGPACVAVQELLERELASCGVAPGSPLAAGKEN
jgi:hydrogenase maturation protease